MKLVYKYDKYKEHTLFIASRCLSAREVWSIPKGLTLNIWSKKAIKCNHCFPGFMFYFNVVLQYCTFLDDCF